MNTSEFIKLYCIFNDSHYAEHDSTIQYAEEMATVLDERGYFDETNETSLYDINQTLDEISSRLHSIAIKIALK